MSLIAYAVRTCLWRALLDRTLAEGRVYDSSVSTLDDLLKGDPKPFIVVSDDGGSGRVEGHQYAAADRKLDIIVELVVGSAVQVGDGYELRVPATDDGFEMSLELIERQIMRVMQADDNVFAELFRALTPGGKRFVIIRGGDTTPRYAARQLTLTCETVNDPPFGEPPQEDWARLVEAFADDEILAPFAPILTSQIIGEPLPDWRKLQAAMGWTRRTQHAVGLGPQIPGEAPAPFVEAEIEAGPGTVTVTP